MKYTFVLLLCASPFAQGYLRIKFRHWFPQYEQHWLGDVPRRETRLQDYYTNNRTSCSSPCACAADCYLSNVTGTIESKFASAQVLLCRVPSVLMFVGPSIAEVAILSTSRPLLAGVIATASPAISISRLFSPVDVNEPLERPTSQILMIWALWVNRQNELIRTVIDAAMLLAAFAALANNVRNSVHLDLRTISGWRCSTILMPLGWSLAAILVHSLGMLAIRARISDPERSSIWSMIRSTTYRQITGSKGTVLSEILFSLASFFTIVHLIFGILDLSSLVFISALEAVEVFGMYAISVLICQFLVALELARLRHSLHQAKVSAESIE